MQIGEYLKRSGRLAWLLVIIPLVAMAAGAAYAASIPTRYVTSATVAVPSFYGTDGANAARQSVATLLEAIASEPVLEQVAQDTGRSVGQLRDGLGTDAPDGTSLARVTWTSTNRERGQEILSSAVGHGFALATQPQLQAAQEAVEVAREEYAAAQEALTQQRGEQSSLRPDQDYRSLASALSRYEARLAEAELEGDQSDVALYSGLVEETATRLADLEGEVAALAGPEDELRRASQNLANLEEERIELTSRLAASEQDAPVTFAATRPASTVMSTTQIVVGAGIAGFVLALLLLALFGSGESERVVQLPDTAEPNKVRRPDQTPVEAPAGTRD